MVEFDGRHELLSILKLKKVGGGGSTNGKLDIPFHLNKGRIQIENEKRFYSVSQAYGV
jgi:hypothetical protein